MTASRSGQRITKGVQRADLRGEADIASGEVLPVVFMESSVSGHRRRAAGDLPGKRVTSNRAQALPAITGAKSPDHQCWPALEANLLIRRVYVPFAEIDPGKSRLNEAAGAADANACSSIAGFSSTVCIHEAEAIFSGRCSIFGMLTIEPFCFITSSGMSIQIPIMAGVCPEAAPRPPQTPAASFKRPNRKCPGPNSLGLARGSSAGALPIES